MSSRPRRRLMKRRVRVRVSGRTVTLSRSVTKTNDGGAKGSSEGEGVTSQEIASRIRRFEKEKMLEYLHSLRRDK